MIKLVSTSNVLVNIGIDIDINITLPPKSILDAIEFSPQSLHIVIAYSNIIDIPVILSNTFINSAP